MYKIALINMPFATIVLPSIALTQLKSVVEERFAGRVDVSLHYLNNDFAHHLGLGLYRDMSDSLEANMCGMGDWFFRDVAFPGSPDNAEEYFQRYFPRRDESFEIRKRLLLAKRRGLDGFLSRLVARYRLADYDLVGFTSMFSQNVASFAMARKLKDKNPALVTVIGGANCEAPMGGRIAAHVEAIDFVFSGPALKSFPQFIACRLEGDEARCHDIQGVFSRQNATPERMTGPGSIGEELPIDVPVPLDYEPFLQTFAQSFADADVEPILTFETSRGCWWGERAHCTFCGLNGGTMMYRAMPAERAVEQFNRMFAQYGSRCSRYQSVDNIMPRSYLKEVFPHITPPPDVSLFYEVKADLKAHEMEILARARVVDLQPGIESIATSTLKLMRKGTTAFQNLGFLKNCVIHGLRPQWNLLIGFPGETSEVYEKYVADIPSLYHLPPPAGAYPVRFDRFSPYFMQQQQYGLDLHPSDFYGFIYPFVEEILSEMIYYFVDRNYTSTYLATMSEWQDRIQAEVDRWRERWEASDGGIAPALYMEDAGAGVVYDSRGGSAVRHALGAAGAQALAFLALPRKAADLAEHLSTQPAALGAGSAGSPVPPAPSNPPDPARLLADLRERRLVFEERELHMSVLLPAPQEGRA
jgi:ribosomal peptide maturation radical SAM protein 1